MSTFFRVDFEVRDNELDIQGIVNNSNYMVYLAHARHKYIESIGVNFIDFVNRKQNLVVTSCTMKFKNSLGPNDKFWVSCKLVETEYPYQFAYHQDIKLLDSSKMIMKAKFYSTCVNESAKEGEERLYVPEMIKRVIEQEQLVVS